MHRTDILNLKTECEKTFYRKIYDFPGTKNSLLLDETTGRLLLSKELETYNESVFSYLKDHHNDHIPEIVSYSIEGEKLTVIEEWIQGTRLDALIDMNQLDTSRKKMIVGDILDGLSFLHNADPQIIHRDIKASNIIVERGGRAVLVDFDAAKTYDPGKSKDTVLIGTVGSAAPEQYGFGASDARTDIYAMGVLLRELFPEDKQWQHAADKATQMDPKNRYQSVKEMKTALGLESPSVWCPPGFRTKNPWKSILAVFGYALILYFSLTMTSESDVSKLQLWVSRICIMFALFMIVDLWTDWSSLFKKLPVRKWANPCLRFLGYAACSVLIFVFWAGVNALVVSMTAH